MEQKQMQYPSHVTTEVERAIYIAALWWLHAILQPKFDNGSEAQGGSLVASMLATVTSVSGPGVTPQAGQQFVDSLYSQMRAQFNARGPRSNMQELSVDYGPDAVLFNAFQAANIPTTRAPWKTDMWIDLRNESSPAVHVSYGYRAKPQQVYPIPSDQESLNAA